MRDEMIAALRARAQKASDRANRASEIALAKTEGQAGVAAQMMEELAGLNRIEAAIYECGAALLESQGPR